VTIAVVFPGQGAQSVGMLADLAADQPEVVMDVVANRIKRGFGRHQGDATIDVYRRCCSMANPETVWIAVTFGLCRT